MTGRRQPEGELHALEIAGEPVLPCQLYVPPGPTPRRLLVSVHGISRNREEHLAAFAPAADRYGAALLLPLFSAERFPDYQRLGRQGHGPRADRALLRAVDEVQTMLDLPEAPFALFGFSGGAQFAHRFALLHPRRVACLGLGSAGWYTWPDEGRRYPHGTAPSPRLPGERFDLRGLLRIPIRVWVGDLDRERDSALNTSPRIDRVQGLTRFERAANWVRAMRRAGVRLGVPARCRLEALPGVGHDFEAADRRAGIGQRLFSDCFGDHHRR